MFEKIYAQVKDIIEYEINSNNEKEKKEFLINIFPSFIRLYFHCFLADYKVNIIYVKENSKFDEDKMIDILLTGVDDKSKNVLFTFLHGLYFKGKYFDNSYVYVMTFPINNPNKFAFEKPVFKTIEPINSIETDIFENNFNPDCY